MAENESTTKVGNKENSVGNSQAENSDVASDTSAENSEELLSLENLDSILAEEDPEFAKSLGDIGRDEVGAVEIYNEGLSLEYTLEDERKLWTAEGSSNLRKKLAKFFPFLPKISFKIKMKRTSLRLSWTKWKEQFFHTIKNLGPILLGGTKKLVGKFREFLSDILATFGSFSLVKKLAFIGLLAVTGSGAYVFYRIATHKFFSPEQDLFLPSLEEWAQKKYFFDTKEKMESFYDSTRTSQNIMELKRMFVNIRRSTNSGPNPMAAFEFYVEGTVSEAVVEIKDREPEIEDLFLRTIEEMTYDQLSAGEGKQLLCDRLRKEINKILTKGKIRRVFIKTAIIKP